jgi:hypothetical protein
MTSPWRHIGVMETTRYISGLNAALLNGAQSYPPEIREAAERLAHGLEPALRLAFMEIAADIAAEVTARLDGDVVDVRLRGGNPEIVVERRVEGLDAPPAPPSPPAPPPVEDEGGMARISLRLPDGLKTQVDEAAATAGVSANTWLIRAIQQVLGAGRPEPDASGGAEGRKRPGRMISGWVR